MTDLPTDLTALRTLEAWLAPALTEVRAAITQAEQREREEQRGRERRPPEPEWLLEAGLNRDAPAVQVHVGGCWNSGRRSRGVARGDALRALVEGVRPCSVCRPDTELGFLEG